MAANPIGLVVAGVAALIGVGVALYKNWSVISDFFVTAWENIKSVVSAGFEYISGVLPKVMEKMLAPFEAVKNGIAKVKAFLFGEEETVKMETVKTIQTPNLGSYYEQGGLVQQHSINNSMNAPVTYAPNITIQGNASKEDIENALMNKQDFEKMMKEYNYNDARLSYGGY